MAARRANSRVPEGLLGNTSRVRQAQALARRREALQRNEASRSDSATAGILDPNELSGDYDFARGLLTTMGGKVRPITVADLKAFRAKAKALGKSFRAGITSGDVIKLSTPTDRDRANDQIRTAVPVWAKQGLVHFITNAGPDSDKERHHVEVRFINYAAAVASPTASKTLATQIVKQGIKFDCDCGRHRYWFRYIATQGGFNEGRAETGFPKIRNPNLTGVGCKHVLRVMKQIGSTPVVGMVAKMIDAGRTQQQKDVAKDARAVTLTDAQAREIANKQAREAGYRRNQVLTAQERGVVERQKKAVAKAVAKAAQSAAQSAAQKQAQKQLEQLVQSSGLSPQQLAALLAQMR